MSEKASARPAAAPLSSAERRDLLVRGYFKRRGLVPPRLVRSARAAIDRMMSEDRRLGRRREDPTAWTHVGAEAPLTALLLESPAAVLAERLLGAGSLDGLPQAQVVVREPGAREPGPLSFHVDGFYPPKGSAPGSASFTLTICVFLSDVTRARAGNFTVCPGSHRSLAKLIRERGFASVSRELPQDKLPKPVQLRGRAGDVVFAHHQLAHAGERNWSSSSRYAVFFRLKHPRHQALWRRAMTELWLEWPGLGAARGARRSPAAGA